MTVITIFRIVFVLNDPCVRASSPSKEFNSTVCGHRNAHRKLIGWGYIGELSLRCKFSSGFDDEPLLIHWNGDNSATADSNA